MTLQQMEYIVAVYRLRHFARAAEHCHVSQPTLSSMIQKLEDELGVKIFDRSTQPVSPTPTGQLIIEQAWRTLIRARRIRDIVAEKKHSEEGDFCLGILPTIAPYLLPRFFPQFVASHPKINLKVSEMKTEQIKSALARGELDAAIVVSLDGMDHFRSETLFYEQFVAYVSETDTLFQRKNIRPADLKNEFVWLLDEGHCFRDQLVKFCSLKSACKSKTTYSLGSIETFMRMVEGGMGVTFLPELAVSQLQEGQRRLVRPFALPIPTREVVMLTTPGFVRHTLLSLIVTAVRDAIPPEMLTLNTTEQRV